MTKKDFELLAKIIREYDYDRDTPDTRRQIMALTFGRELKRHYLNFNMRRFIMACGVEWQDWFDAR